MIPLEELKVYITAMEVGDLVWDEVDSWPYFEKSTIGKQFVRAADSMAFNIAEGYGRFFYKENRQFCYYSRGSAKETQTALTKAEKRGLIKQDVSNLIANKISFYFILMAGYIKSIGDK